METTAIDTINTSLSADTRIDGFEYTTSRRDGCLVAFAHEDRAVSFTVGQVTEWHLSRQRGSNTLRLGATLADGRVVFVVRSALPSALARPLDSIAKHIRQNFADYSGSPSSILFLRGERQTR